MGAHIDTYEQGIQNHEPERDQQAAPAPPGARLPLREGAREGADPGPGSSLLQERTREGRDRARPRQGAARQAARAREAGSRPPDRARAQVTALRRSAPGSAGSSAIRSMTASAPSRSEPNATTWIPARAPRRRRPEYRRRRRSGLAASRLRACARCRSAPGGPRRRSRTRPGPEERTQRGRSAPSAPGPPARGCLSGALCAGSARALRPCPRERQSEVSASSSSSR